MAWRIPQSITASTGNAVDLAEVDEDVFVGAHITLAAEQGVVIYGSEGGHTARIFGTLASPFSVIVLESSTRESPNSIYLAASAHLEVLATGRAIESFGSSATIENSGFVYSAADGVALGCTGSATTTVTNTGTIETAGFGLGRAFYSTETIAVYNSGIISGAASYTTFDGNPDNTINIDRVTNRGTMIGRVDLGGGDDLYDGRLGQVQGGVFGGGGNDRIYGGRANEAIDGGANNDNLYGGLGADRLIGGSGLDLARYDDANHGNLVIRLDAPQANTGAAAGDTYSGIEGIVAGAGHDTVFGDTGGNRLYGLGGNDTLDGRAGMDRMEGGIGGDLFRFSTALSSTNVDTVVDFQHGVDHIALSRAIFADVGTALSTSEFGAMAAAGRFIIYNQATGRLFYDEGGAGVGTGPKQFATVTPGTVLDINDFVMV